MLYSYIGIFWRFIMKLQEVLEEQNNNEALVEDIENSIDKFIEDLKSKMDNADPSGVSETYQKELRDKYSDLRQALTNFALTISKLKDQ